MVPGVIRRTTSRRIGALPVRVLRVLHLLGHGDAEAAADQAGEIGFGGVVRDAAHRDRRAGVLAALGQRDVQRGGGGFGVGEEQLVEVAHAEEQQRVGMFRLGANHCAMAGEAPAAGGRDGMVMPRPAYTGASTARYGARRAGTFRLSGRRPRAAPAPGRRNARRPGTPLPPHAGWLPPCRRQVATVPRGRAGTDRLRARAGEDAGLRQLDTQAPQQCAQVHRAAGKFHADHTRDGHIADLQRLNESG